MAVAGRQTLTRDLGEESTWTTWRMKDDERLDQPWSSSIRFCIAVRAYYAKLMSAEGKVRAKGRAYSECVSVAEVDDSKKLL